MKSNKKGYTLIEILVVISIIGFIASIAMYTLNSARVKGRDAKRMADLEVIGKAIELYYDRFNHYPLAGIADANAQASSYDAVSWDVLQAELDEFITLPVDPRNDGISPAYVRGDNFTYTYFKFGPKPQAYNLIAQLEDKNNDLRCEVRCWGIYG